MRHEMLTLQLLARWQKKGMLSQHFVTHVIPSTSSAGNQGSPLFSMNEFHVVVFSILNWSTQSCITSSSFTTCHFSVLYHPEEGLSTRSKYRT